MLVPDIERDGHHGVEDDDVGPECEEGGEACIVAILSGQEDRELWAFIQLPDVVSNRQDGAHEGQKTENLHGKFWKEFRGQRGVYQDWLDPWALVKRYDS